MKSILLIVSIAVLPAIGAYGQQAEEKAQVQQVITQFANLTASQDAAALAELLAPDYRVVMNQLFGSNEAISMSREMYLEKIRSKEWGGEKRQVETLTLDINGKNANAEVSFMGEEMRIISYLQLIQDADGKWKLLQDLPTVK